MPLIRLDRGEKFRKNRPCPFRKHIIAIFRKTHSFQPLQFVCRRRCRIGPNPPNARNANRVANTASQPRIGLPKSQHTAFFFKLRNRFLPTFHFHRHKSDTSRRQSHIHPQIRANLHSAFRCHIFHRQTIDRRFRQKARIPTVDLPQQHSVDIHPVVALCRAIAQSGEQSLSHFPFFQHFALRKTQQCHFSLHTSSYIFLRKNKRRSPKPTGKRNFLKMESRYFENSYVSLPTTTRSVWHDCRDQTFRISNEA